MERTQWNLHPEIHISKPWVTSSDCTHLTFRHFQFVDMNLHKCTTKAQILSAWLEELLPWLRECSQEFYPHPSQPKPPFLSQHTTIAAHPKPLAWQCCMCCTTVAYLTLAPWWYTEVIWVFETLKWRRWWKCKFLLLWWRSEIWFESISFLSLIL